MTLTIENCNPKFIKMIRELHAAYSRELKFGFEVNFSGNAEDFKYFFNKIDPNKLYGIIINGDNNGQTKTAAAKP